MATSQRATIDNLKAQLAQAEAKVQELTKASETAKTGKGGRVPEEKVKPAEARQPEPAKLEKKAAKK